MPRPPIFSKYTVIVILIVAAALFFYFPSYSRYRELKMEAEKLEGQVDVLQKQVLDLQREKQLMRTDKNYLEAVIRKELGLVEPGEVVYEFEKKPSRKPSSASSLVSNQTKDQRPKTTGKKAVSTPIQPSKKL